MAGRSIVMEVLHRTSGAIRAARCSSIVEGYEVPVEAIGPPDRLAWGCVKRLNRLVRRLAAPGKIRGQGHELDAAEGLTRCRLRAERAPGCRRRRPAVSS